MDCGIVILESTIDQGPEWRAFTSEERNKRSRVGSPMTYTVHDKGLSTIIDWHDKDFYGKKFAPRRRALIYRLRKWQVRTRVHSSMDRNLAVAMSELDRMSSQLGIPRGVKESSAVLYHRAIERKLIRGRSIEAMVAASIYAACRMRKIPRTLDEIARYSRINKKELGRCYRLILRELEINIPIASSIDFIPRFGAELSLTGRTQKRAAEIITEARAKGLTAGKDPTGLAAMGGTSTTKSSSSIPTVSPSASTTISTGYAVPTRSAAYTGASPRPPARAGGSDTGGRVPRSEYDLSPILGDESNAQGIL